MNTITIFEHDSLTVGGTEEKAKGFEQNHFDILAENYEKTEANKRDYDKHYIISDKSKNTIKFRQFVGGIAVDNLLIEILPKISKYEDPLKDTKHTWRKVLYQMILLVYDLDVHWSTAYTGTQKSVNILELFYELYQKKLQGLYHRGFLRSYVKETRTEPFLKGRWNLAQQLSRNPIDKLHFTCTFQHYTLNHLLNQILKKAGDITAKHVVDKYAVNAMLHQLEEVLIPNTISWNKVVYNNKNHYYRDTIRLAKLIINTEVNVLSKTHEVQSFVFDMNFLFEKYIARLLEREVMRDQRRSIKTQSSKKFWKSRELKPDVILEIETKRKFILDTKWKEIETEEKKIVKNISIDDIKQMFCYNELFGCEKAFLIYPSHDDTDIPIDPEPFQKEKPTHIKKEKPTHSLGVIKVSLLQGDTLDPDAGKNILDLIISA